MILKDQVIAILRKTKGNSAEIDARQTRNLKVRQVCERAAESLGGWIEAEVDALARESQLIHSVIVDDVCPEESDTPRRAALLRVNSGEGIRICKQVGRKRAMGREPTG